jgi:hypothetical protein
VWADCAVLWRDITTGEQLKEEALRLFSFSFFIHSYDRIGVIFSPFFLFVFVCVVLELELRDR